MALQDSTQFQQITIETDSKVAVKCLTGSVCVAQLENIIYDCKEFLCNLPNVTVKFIRRSKNVAAHELVSIASKKNTFLGFGPSFNS